MQRLFLVFLLLFVANQSSAKAIVSIKGKADSYVGKEINVYFFEDYMSLVRTKVASSVVKNDSTFSLSFFNHETRKIYVEIGKNNFSMYIQPNGEYNLEVERNSPYLDQNAVGIEVGFLFLGLDPTDINYKILLFEDKQLSFLTEFYNQRTMMSTQFVEKLDSFKLALSTTYEADTSTFFKTYVKYTIASLDNLSFLGQRNEYEKYDFYIHNEPVAYQNDRYMDYINHYYKLYEAELSNEVSSRLYEGVIKSSPSIIMNALGGDYALRNVRLRELVLTRMLADMFYSEVYPKTNLIEIIDSLANYALFEEHKGIAANIKFRLLDLKPGTRMPEFSIDVQGVRKYKNDYAGKHLYVQFVHEDLMRSLDDLKLITPLHQKYSKHIHFLTILVLDDEQEVEKDFSDFISEHKIAWDFSVVSKNDEILTTLRVPTYPYYMLVDATGYVVGAPALSPRPNNEYETIEHNLHSIARYYRLMEQQH